jgi:hypothetical protein
VFCHMIAMLLNKTVNEWSYMHASSFQFHVSYCITMVVHHICTIDSYSWTNEF